MSRNRGVCIFLIQKDAKRAGTIIRFFPETSCTELKFFRTEFRERLQIQKRR